MRIAATLADDTACGLYRTALPWSEMIAGGIEGRMVKQMSNDPGHDLYKGVDMMSFQRLCDANIAAFALQVLREGGMKLMGESDDLLNHLDPSNKMAWDYYTKENRVEVFQAFVAEVDAMTTTTETLARELEEMGAKKTYVLPNCLPNWVPIMQQGKNEHDDFKVVYTTGSSHRLDVKHVSYGVGKTLKRLGKNGDVTFTSYGHGWMKELGLADEPWAQYRPWTPDNGAYLWSLVDYDVGIAPLKPSRFNRSKSPIKVTEYRAAGIVPLVSDIEPYHGQVEHGVDGFVCKSDKDWSEALTVLYEDRGLIVKMREAGYERVEDTLIKNNIHRWIEAFEEVIAS